ncbi:hypothetical protein [Saccharopolyspora spinosa]|uniref:hypothetical protein n=1 Tax=Saccharopolyspora spinosa TaxID=60894 RepID=UPI00192AAEC0|nr:hypothetical protein [Saccharopolyspora spinosa]
MISLAPAEFAVGAFDEGAALVPVTYVAGHGECAHATVSLLMQAASFITGAVRAVDGGLTIRNA